MWMSFTFRLAPPWICFQGCKQCWKTLAQCLERAPVLAWRWISLLPLLSQPVGSQQRPLLIP